MSPLWYTPQSISLATAQIHPTKTTTHFHYLQNGFSPRLITSFGHIQDDGGILTILIGEYVKLGSKGMQLTRNQTRRKQVLISPGVQVGSRRPASGARH